MARKTAPNGNLEQAMTLLIQNQAAFVGDMRENHKQMAEIRRDLEQIKGILLRHEHILATLPEAIREKIGLQAKQD